MSHKRKKITVFRTGHLGDTVCAIPAFWLIRESFPDATLTLLCDAPSSHLVSALEVIEHLNVFDRIHSYRSRRGGWTALQLAARIFFSRPDMVIVLPQNRETPEELRRKLNFFRNCGVRDVRGKQMIFPAHDWNSNEPERLVQLLNGMGIPGKKPQREIPVNEQCRSSIKANLLASGVDHSKPFLVFCGGGKAATQRWPMERYAEALSSLAKKFDLTVVALGSRDDVARYRSELIPRFPEVKLLAQELAVPELFELLRLAVAYLGNDTGPMHVAASVGCPVAAIISARNPPGIWDPDVLPHLVVRHRTVCENCFLNECVAERHRCMSEITVDDALSQIAPFLETVMNDANIKISHNLG